MTSQRSSNGQKYFSQLHHHHYRQHHCQQYGEQRAWWSLSKPLEFWVASPRPLSRHSHVDHLSTNSNPISNCESFFAFHHLGPLSIVHHSTLISGPVQKPERSILSIFRTSIRCCCRTPSFSTLLSNSLLSLHSASKMSELEERKDDKKRVLHTMMLRFRT
jgi:hypothetical protein